MFSFVWRFFVKIGASILWSQYFRDRKSIVYSRLQMVRTIFWAIFNRTDLKISVYCRYIERFLIDWLAVTSKKWSLFVVGSRSSRLQALLPSTRTSEWTKTRNEWTNEGSLVNMYVLQSYLHTTALPIRKSEICRKRTDADRTNQEEWCFFIIDSWIRWCSARLFLERKRWFPS